MSRAAVVRSAYEALAQGDLERVRAAFAPDAVWILPGRSAVAETHRGWDAIQDVCSGSAR